MLSGCEHNIDRYVARLEIQTGCRDVRGILFSSEDDFSQPRGQA